MAVLSLDLTEAKPRFLSQGSAPPGGYKVRVLSAELRDNERSDGQNILCVVELLAGSNKDGVGMQQNVVLFPPSAPFPAKPDKDADKKVKDAYQMAVNSRDRFVGALVSLGLPQEKVVGKKITIDTDKHLVNKEGYLYIEAPAENEANGRQDWMTAKQYEDILSGKMKIAPRTPRKSDGKGDGKAGGGGGKASDIKDDLDDLDNDKGAKDAGSSAKGGSASSSSSAASAASGGAKSAPVDDLDL